MLEDIEQTWTPKMFPLGEVDDFTVDIADDTTDWAKWQLLDSKASVSASPEGNVIPSSISFNDEKGTVTMDAKIVRRLLEMVADKFPQDFL
jgi:hypothetical protein